MIIRTLLVVATLASSPGAAQLVELGGGMTMPDGDVAATRDAGFAVHASGWLQLADNWLAGAAVEYARLPFDRFDDPEVVAADGFDLSIRNAILQTRWIVVGAGGPLQPSLVIGAGLTRQEAALGRVTVTDGRTFMFNPEPDWGMIAAGGLGLYFRIADAIGIQTDARYILTGSLETEANRWQIDAALRVRVR